MALMSRGSARMGSKPSTSSSRSSRWVIQVAIDGPPRTAAITRSKSAGVALRLASSVSSRRCSSTSLIVSGSRVRPTKTSRPPGGDVVEGAAHRGGAAGGVEHAVEARVGVDGVDDARPRRHDRRAGARRDAGEVDDGQRRAGEDARTARRPGQSARRRSPATSSGVGAPRVPTAWQPMLSGSMSASSSSSRPGTGWRNRVGRRRAGRPCRRRRGRRARAATRSS